MNVLWLSAPYRKDDIIANRDAVWVYTENEEQNGGGEITEFMRSTENCHPLIVRQHHGKDGFYKEDNILDYQELNKYLLNYFLLYILKQVDPYYLYKIHLIYIFYILKYKGYYDSGKKPLKRI